MNKCNQRTKLLKKCGMKVYREPASDGKYYCFNHHPDKAEERKFARSRGGRGRSKPSGVDRPSVSTTEAYSEPPTSKKTMTSNGYIARSGMCPRCLFKVEEYSEDYGGGPGTYYCPSCGLGGARALNPIYSNEW